MENNLNFETINFLANGNDIDKFEEFNHNDLINVFEVDGKQKQIVISRKFKNKDIKCHIDLLRIDKDDSNYYIYIKNYSIFLNSQKK